jgi:hypothetical protein
MTWKMDPVEQKYTVQGGRGHCKGLSRAALDSGLKEVWRNGAETTTLYKGDNGFYLSIGSSLTVYDTLTEAQDEASYYRRNN